MKFRTRLTMAFALLTLLVISVELVLSHLDSIRHDQQIATRNLLAASQQTVRSLDLVLLKLSHDIEMVAKSAFLNESGRSLESVNRRLANFCGGSAPLERLTFIDTNGILTADSSENGIGKSATNILWKRGMAGESNFYLQPAEPDGFPVLQFFAPVKRGSSPSKGVVVATIPLSHVMELVNGFQSYSMTGSDRLRFELFDKNRFIYSSDGVLSGNIPSYLPERTESQTVSDTGNSLQIITLTDRLNKSFAGKCYLRVTIPKSQIFADSRSRLLKKALVNSILCSVGIIFIYILAGCLSHPLEALTDAVKRRGEGDPEALQVLPQRQDEFAVLQESLQEMSNRLIESEERFRSFFNAMAEGGSVQRMIYSNDGKPVDYLFEEVNKSFELIMDLPREKVIGNLASNMFSGAEIPFLDRFETVLTNGHCSSFEFYLKKNDRYLNVSVCRIGVELFATLFFDITEQKRHEKSLCSTMAELKEANEAKSRFLAVMSHEIRTPLNGISGMVQLLHDMEMPPLQREFVDNIETSADSLLTVINDILDFSKIEAGKLELEELPFIPNKLLNDALRVMKLRAQAKGLQISLEIKQPLPEVLLGDPHRLTQVLNNLLGNAIKFTSGGEILVRASVEGLTDSSVNFSVEVQDSGIGMDEATLKSVFEPYIQANSSTTRKYGGTGLGLAICKQLVELMKGNIGIISRPGFGSTFSFVVPLKLGTLGILPDESDKKKHPVAENLIVRPLTILIAEDQPVNQRFVAEIISKKGHISMLANNGQEAVDIWNSTPVDLVLMDIQMPVMDGLKALAAIRAREDETKQHTPIIALTAHAIVGDRERLLNSGFDGYLSKPLQVAKLFQEMARVIEEISNERRS